MPDIVNPHCASLFGVFLGIDAFFGQAFLEHRVNEAQICPDAAVESVV
jgi:hypothetical protein